eukprot:TRINITY_DN2388_c0_g2_i1.p1 TRINITY_DN2388_c0_g2~~TRINITY_DN2388_c0_g2_i1.p1  ORF type:complete len:836 (-),score=202.58 TRINITY_DN2388_c0_g2_i1:283-2790(-)
MPAAQASPAPPAPAPATPRLPKVPARAAPPESAPRLPPARARATPNAMTSPLSSLAFAPTLSPVAPSGTLTVPSASTSAAAMAIAFVAPAPKHPRLYTKPTKTTAVDASAPFDEPEWDEEEEMITASTTVATHDYRTLLKLKPDHPLRPLWVLPNKRIFLEASSPFYKEAYDFLIAIAVPVSRPAHIHTYDLKMSSLQAAVSIGLETESIVRFLRRFSKTDLSEEVVAYIRKCTKIFGKVKLVLKKNAFFIESSSAEILQEVLKNDVISRARVHRDGGFTTEQAQEGIQFGKPKDAAEEDKQKETQMLDDDSPLDVVDPNKVTMQELLSFEISSNMVNQVREQCQKMEMPLLEEYDFRNDSQIPTLPIALKPTTSLRPYQEKSLSKMFGNGRARSGIIVLPCGAGKTLVGVTAATTVRKSTVVVCNSATAVDQWVHQFRLWADIDPKLISKFTSEHKEALNPNACILITTYSMLSHSGAFSDKGAAIMSQMTKRDWGLLILDEVHVTPAEAFQKVLQVARAHCKLGLTATLVREDNKIKTLDWLIGPKLYEANWLDLMRAGHIANAKCCEVWCQMTSEFYREYLNATSVEKKKMLWILNPNKIMATDILIKKHIAQGDQIMVFSDSVFGLQVYAQLFGRPMIYGDTKPAERRVFFQQFQEKKEQCIFLSKVGDIAIDLPSANVIIQISSHGGSRRQEAQRLGRILRAKENKDGGYNAFFYSLVSRDTQEAYYSTKRQQFLVDQGFSFSIITDIFADYVKSSPDHKLTDLKYSKHSAQLDMLAKVLSCSEVPERGLLDASLSSHDQQAKKNRGHWEHCTGRRRRDARNIFGSLGWW